MGMPFGPDHELSWKEIICIAIVIISLSVSFSWCCANAMCDMPDTWECYESDNVDGVVLTWFPKVIPVVMMGVIVSKRDNGEKTWDEGLMFYAFPYQITIAPDLTSIEDKDD